MATITPNAKILASRIDFWEPCELIDVQIHQTLINTMLVFEFRRLLDGVPHRIVCDVEGDLDRVGFAALAQSVLEGRRICPKLRQLHRDFFEKWV